MSLMWYENLPEQCPPPDAEHCSGIYFRLVKNENPQNDDFISQRALYPDKQFIGIDECVVKSLSVFDDYTQANMRLKLPKFRKYKVIKLELGFSDGKIKKTFGPGHYSWWRSQEFDVESSILRK